jgi:hypothetical protein
MAHTLFYYCKELRLEEYHKSHLSSTKNNDYKTKVITSSICLRLCFTFHLHGTIDENLLTLGDLPKS